MKNNINIEDLNICRTIRFCYMQGGFTILIEDDKYINDVKFYTEDEYGCNLIGLFEIDYNNQTDEELIDLLIEKIEAGCFNDEFERMGWCHVDRIKERLERKNQSNK